MIPFRKNLNFLDIELKNIIRERNIPLPIEYIVIMDSGFVITHSIEFNSFLQVDNQIVSNLVKDVVS